MAYNPFTKSSVAQQTSRLNVNQTGGTLPKGTPVKLTSSGLDLIDVSVETDVDALAGILKEDTSDSSNGTIISSGSVENLSTSFPIGSVLYISKTGILTNVKPSIGVNGFGEGDWIIKVGMIAPNVEVPTDKDLLVNLQVMGQL